MSDDIIEKLKVQIIKDDFEESDIVYILVEMYKFLDRENKLSDFEMIEFYRNWCCHYSLDRNPVPANFNDAKKAIDNQLALEQLSEEFFRAQDKFASYRLKENIDNFIDKFLLIEKSKFKWDNFKLKLIDVIIDQPLFVRLANNGHLLFKYDRTRGVTIEWNSVLTGKKKV